MVFDYDKQEVFTQSIDIVDIGNFAIRCSSSSSAQDFYIIVKTVMGKSCVLKFGPCFPDLNVLCDGFGIALKRFDYKESSIIKEINSIIQSDKLCIDNVIEIPEYEAFSAIPEISSDTILS